MNFYSFKMIRLLLVFPAVFFSTAAHGEGADLEYVLDESFCEAEGYKGDNILKIKVVREELCPYFDKWLTQFKRDAKLGRGATLRPQISELSTGVAGMWSGNQRNIFLSITWTLVDDTGALLWADTVQADVSGITGNAFRIKKLFRSDLLTLLESTKKQSEASFKDWRYFL